MAKIAILGDVHVGIRGNSPLFDEYFNRFYTEIFFPTLEKRGITTIVQMGDFFDNRKSLSMVAFHSAKEYLIDKLACYTTYILVGNHDAPYKNNLKANSPELFLGMSSSVRIISSPTETEYGLMIPWICDANMVGTMEKIESSGSHNLFGHLELAGFNMHKNYVMEHGMDANVFKKFKNVFSGHYHCKSSKGNVTYVGTPVEHSWSDHGDEKGFHIFDTITGELEFIHNPISIHEKITYNGGYFGAPIEEYTNKIIKLTVEARGNIKDYDRFIAKLYEILPAELSIIDNSTSVNYVPNPDDIRGTVVTPDSLIIDESGMGASADDTIGIIEQYIDGIDSDINKGDIKSIFRKLYIEANS